jgi:hypothetical protein
MRICRYCGEELTPGSREEYCVKNPNCPPTSEADLERIEKAYYDQLPMPSVRFLGMVEGMEINGWMGLRKTPDGQRFACTMCGSGSFAAPLRLHDSCSCCGSTIVEITGLGG